MCSFSSLTTSKMTSTDWIPEEIFQNYSLEPNKSKTKSLQVVGDKKTLTVIKNDDKSENSGLKLKSDADHCCKEKYLSKDDNNPDVPDLIDSDDLPLAKIKNVKHKDRKNKKRKKFFVEETGSSGVVNNVSIKRKLAAMNFSSDQICMVRLTWEEVETERRKALESESFNRQSHRCYHCAVGFNHRLKLESHMMKHSPSHGPLVCEVCSIRCKNAASLYSHLRRHRVRWRCLVCGGAWSRLSVAADHYARSHGAGAPLATHECHVCGHKDVSLGRLRVHMRDHAESKNCQICGKTFSDSNALRTHTFIHKGDKEHECPKCNKTFLYKRAMEIHLETHQPPASLYCGQCDVVFKSRMSYYHHMRYILRHIDPARLRHVCSECGKRFAAEIRLKEHMRALHLGLKPISCSVPSCAFTCSSRPVLRAHVRSVHGGVRARNHVCHVCGKAYTTKRGLEGHVRSHTGERPYICSLCPATFGYSAALYNHNKLVHLKMKNVRNRSSHQSIRATPDFNASFE